VLPASSNTSAVRYSRIATKYTAVVAITCPLAAAHDFNNLWIHPTGNSISGVSENNFCTICYPVEW